jgi:membrane protein DedA with SNARE-associated domain
MTAPLPWPSFGHWLPFGQAAGFFVATFILEDVATVGAGLLLALGSVTWATAFWACFLGIWSGDAGLYALARIGGRRWFEKSRWHRFGTKVDQSEQWFTRRGIPILIFSRMLPGARLPTYLAAGFLRVPLKRFLWVTGVASFIWTIAILGVTRLAGPEILQWLTTYRRAGFFLCGVIVFALTFWKGMPRIFSRRRRQHLAAALGRWLRWEFWPAWLFYPPVAIYCIWLAIKYRGLTLPAAANPGIFTGGIVGESKDAILKPLFTTSPEFTAQAELLKGTTVAERLNSLDEISQRLGIFFPFILKPDTGQRGAGVKLIQSREQAAAYLQRTSAPLLLQRYAAGPQEAGIFYYRFPHESKGHVFAITEKIFPRITGDGRSTIEQLIWNDPRARFMAAKYLARLKGREWEILDEGVTVKLVEAGNHAEGCVFVDGMKVGSEALTARIDEISQKLNGFFIGRYDIRYQSEAELRTGENFQIIELNGAASEATSIYDARTSLFEAYRTLFRQWDLVFAIGAANRNRGFVPARAREIWRAWRNYVVISASYPPAD